MACYTEIKAKFDFIDQLVPCFVQISFRKKRVELGHLTNGMHIASIVESQIVELCPWPGILQHKLHQTFQVMFQVLGLFSYQYIINKLKLTSP